MQLLLWLPRPAQQYSPALGSSFALLTHLGSSLTPAAHTSTRREHRNTLTSVMERISVSAGRCRAGSSNMGGGVHGV